MTPAERKIVFAFILLVTNYILWAVVRYRGELNGHTRYHATSIAHTLEDHCETVIVLVGNESS